MLWDHRTRPLLFAGIALQEFDPKAGKLVGPVKNIFQGTDLKLVEGAASLQAQRLVLSADRRGRHRLRACRDLRPLAQHRRALRDPSAQVHRHRQGHPAQSGAARRPWRLVETPDGKTYLVHLMGRPTTQKRRCVLGRETGIQEAEWRDDDWLWLKGGGNVPTLDVERARHARRHGYWAEQRYSFDNGLPMDFQWLRTPETERIFKPSGGKLTPVRPRVDRLLVRAGAGGAPPDPFLLRRGDDARFLARPTSAPVRRAHRPITAATTSTTSPSPPIPTAQRELLIMSSEMSHPDGKLTLSRPRRCRFRMRARCG